MYHQYLLGLLDGKLGLGLWGSCYLVLGIYLHSVAGGILGIKGVLVLLAKTILPGMKYIQKEIKLSPRVIPSSSPIFHYILLGAC
jgi:hypothetical protein